jgi:hypothetical protein
VFGFVYFAMLNTGSEAIILFAAIYIAFAR